MNILVAIISVLYVFELVHIIHHVLFSENNPLVVLLCPTYSICSDLARATDMNLAGTIATSVVYSIVVMPALVAYYVIAGVFMVALGLFALWCFLFKKKY